MDLLFIFFAFLCECNIVSGLTNVTSEFTVDKLDHVAATKASSLLQQNLDDEFSWNDPELVRMLSRDVFDLDAKQKLVKRVPPPLNCVTAPNPAPCAVDGTPFGNRIPKQGALLSFPQCVGCAGDASTDGWTIDKFTTDFFLKTRIIPTSELKDVCVFYTQRKTAKETPSGLSEAATEWACSSPPVNGNKGKLVTIWMMWPYNTESDQGNYWVLYNNALPNENAWNWLKPVYDAEVAWKAAGNKFDNKKPLSGPINTFFSYMSRAMALSCSGIVYVMTDDPNNLPDGGIWPLQEFPALQQQAAAGLVTQAIAVPYDASFESTNEKDNWRYVNLAPGAKAFPRDTGSTNNYTWLPYIDENGEEPDFIREKSYKERTEQHFQQRMRRMHEAHEDSKLEARGLEKRGSCSSGQIYEPAGHDFFGYGH